jgi:hypothetical protein
MHAARHRASIGADTTGRGRTRLRLRIRLWRRYGSASVVVTTYSDKGLMDKWAWWGPRRCHPRSTGIGSGQPWKRPGRSPEYMSWLTADSNGSVKLISSHIAPNPDPNHPHLTFSLVAEPLNLQAPDTRPLPVQKLSVRSSKERHLVRE